MIVFIHHSVNPYRVAFFNKLKKTGIGFKVYFLSAPAKNRRWKISDFNMKFNFEILKGQKIYFPGNDHSYFQLNSAVWSVLRKDNPDIVITIGWNYLAAFVGYVFAKLHRRKLVIWSESTLYENSLQRKLTAPFVKHIVRQSDYLIAAGTRAKEYLISLGAEKRKILIAYYTVDTEKLISQAKKNKNAYLQIRNRYNLSKRHKIVLYVGGFIKRKGIETLLGLAKEMKENNSIHFIYVGFGPMLSDMKKYIRLNSLSNIIIPGFVRNEEIIKYYLACDVFILPSLEETWGLVVNEAMCAGKTVLVSKYAGVSADLVKRNLNGYVIDPKDIKDIAKIISSLLSNPKKLRLMGNESIKLISKINIEKNISVIKMIIDKIITGANRHLSLFLNAQNNTFIY